MTERRSSAPERPVAALGLILIVGGGVLLAAQLMDLDLGRVGWPFFVIAPGIVLLLAGLASAGGVGLTIAGTIVTMVGLILLFQNATGLYATWAYAWALTGPFGSGLGIVLHGIVHRRPHTVRDGLWPMLTGLGLFVVGFVFFEGIIGLSGDRLDLPGWALPAVLILAGVAVLAWAFSGRGRSSDDRGGVASE